MFIGHLALGFAAKRVTPKVSLAVLFAAAQFADLLMPSGRNTGAASSRETPAQQLAGFVAKFTPSIAKEGRAALTRMRKLVPGAVQMVYDNWNGLVVGFGPTERPSEAVVSILMAPGHITLCFIQDGPDLPDPHHLLKGSGNVVRHVRLESARDLDRPAIRALVKTAVARSDVPFDPRTRGKLLIKSISPKQRPRRPDLRRPA